MAKSKQKSSQKDLKSMSFEDAGRENKKQAKREAKLGLKLTKARAEVQKFEKKLAKAIRTVQTYEFELEELRQNVRNTQDGDVAVVVTTTAPEEFGSIETQIVEEILEEILHSVDTEQTDNQENNQQTTENPEEQSDQTHPTADAYEGEQPVPNLTSVQPGLAEKPADAAHTYDHNQYEAGDTKPYPTGQGGLVEPDAETSAQAEGQPESTTEARESAEDTQPHPAISAHYNPTSTEN